jgi:hypothetical protein
MISTATTDIASGIPGAQEYRMPHVGSGAVLSPCQRYRYVLHRRWSMYDHRFVLWVMLNPSTADAETDDRTIRRCAKISKELDYPGMVVLNLFAYRSKSPLALYDAYAPIGPSNDDFIRRIAPAASLILAAWGNCGGVHDRDYHVLKMLPAQTQCCGITQKGFPHHPLFLRKDFVILPYVDNIPGNTRTVKRFLRLDRQHV